MALSYKETLDPRTPLLEKEKKDVEAVKFQKKEGKRIENKKAENITSKC